jgi:hypothetical protein
VSSSASAGNHHQHQEKKMPINAATVSSLWQKLDTLTLTDDESAVLHRAFDLANEAASAGEVQGFADIGSLGFKAIKIPVAGKQTGPVVARPLEAEADDE